MNAGQILFNSCIMRGIDASKLSHTSCVVKDRLFSSTIKGHNYAAQDVIISGVDADPFDNAV